MNEHWIWDMTTEEQEAFHADVERIRGKLPERIKGLSAATQDLYIIHGVELKGREE